tara:strand:- start:605 stop:1162 length:558 start_codon:yes stop_codon:yes gene_type:complete
MERRQFIKVGALSTIGLLGGASVLLSTHEEGQDETEALTVSAVIAKLEALSGKRILHTGTWNPAKIFTHCAQSIEFSMTGYPEHKSDLFKNTLGSLAFSAFSLKGSMVHALDEVIPGAPVISIDDKAMPEEQLEALTRLKKAFFDFNQFEGTLEPHFAYGQLTKAEYEAAHVMHVYNHFDELSVV